MNNNHTYVCIFCHSITYNETLPVDWNIVRQSLVCSECQLKVERDGGYAVVKMGAYIKDKDNADRA